MIWKIFIFICWFTGAALAQRDPFWPIGYLPTESRPRPQSTKEPKASAPVEEVRSLTPVELRQLAREEADRIRESIQRKATMKAGNRIYTYVQEKWVTVGDSFTVEVLGKRYRLEILSLTTENIELEAHPISE